MVTSYPFSYRSCAMSCPELQHPTMMAFFLSGCAGVAPRNLEEWKRVPVNEDMPGMEGKLASPEWPVAIITCWVC